MLPRVCEPPPQDAKLDAEAYREMDHEEVNKRFVLDLLESGPVGPRVVDLGCGPALIPIMLCETLEAIAEGSACAEGSPGIERSGDHPHCNPNELQLMGVDSCVEMLELAQVEIDFAGRLDQIQLEHADLNDISSLQSELADTVISNTVLHHLDSPENALRLAMKVLRPGGRLFIRDLYRPENETEVERLVELHGGAEDHASPATAPRQLLRQSLHASLTLAEIRTIVSSLGIDPASVSMTSDRHWTLDCVRPENVD